jgi:hypothetical protein
MIIGEDILQNRQYCSPPKGLGNISGKPTLLSVVALHLQSPQIHHFSFPKSLTRRSEQPGLWAQRQVLLVVFMVTVGTQISAQTLCFSAWRGRGNHIVEPFAKSLIKNGGAMLYVVMAMTRLNHRVRKRLTRFAHWTVRIILVVYAVLGDFFSLAGAEKEDEARESGRLLAVLLDSGRVASGHNQELINDPDKGHKSFTPRCLHSG